MTCLQDCLMEPKRDSETALPRATPSWMLLGCRRHFGIVVVYFSSEIWGNWFKQRGFFFVFPPTQKVLCTVLETSCFWKGAGRFAAGSCITSVSQRSCVKRHWVMGEMSQETPCVRWKPASYGFVLRVVETRRRVAPGASPPDVLPGGGEAAGAAR